MVEGGMRCVKYLLFLFNLIFVIAGIGLIAAGAYVKIKLGDYYNFLNESYMGPGILLIIVGVIIFLLAFFGCCGAVKENYCLTMTFAICLAIIFILEIAGGIAAFVLRDKIEDDIKDILNNNINKYNNTMKTSWDQLQNELECCGANSSSDWEKHQLPIPDSCCDKNKGPCMGHPSTAQAYSEGCVSKFENWVQGKVVIIGGVGIGLAFVQVVGVVFACCLARAIKKEYEVV